MAIIADTSKYAKLRDALEPLGIETAAGPQALTDAMDRPDFSMVVTATVGYSGLAPTIRAIQAGKDIALANKETLVVAGELIKELLKVSSSRIYPVDSEHSAIYQCLVGESHNAVECLIITASGGPFRRWTPAELEQATVKDALRHPNWNMGAKITIDSATMINKAFEIIEAHWLFDIPGERIHAVVHPQSIIHSMVEFRDGAIKAQLGLPDMHLPIRYALFEGTRWPIAPTTPRLGLKEMAELTFEAPDTARFPNLQLAYRALKEKGTTACIINAANEVAVAAFLRGEIRFLDINRIVEATLDKVAHIASPSYDDYVATNDEARRVASDLMLR